jgi:hypothetical protein
MRARPGRVRAGVGPPSAAVECPESLAALALHHSRAQRQEGSLATRTTARWSRSARPAVRPGDPGGKAQTLPQALRGNIHRHELDMGLLKLLVKHTIAVALHLCTLRTLLCCSVQCLTQKIAEVVADALGVRMSVSRRTGVQQQVGP